MDGLSQCVKDECVTSHSVLSTNGAYLFTLVFLFDPNSTFLKYIWQGRGPRLALRTLQRPKRLGGLGVPDIRKYYEVITLKRILDWQHGVSTKAWVSFEKFLAGRNLFHAHGYPRHIEVCRHLFLQ